MPRSAVAGRSVTGAASRSGAAASGCTARPRPGRSADRRDGRVRRGPLRDTVGPSGTARDARSMMVTSPGWRSANRRLIDRESEIARVVDRVRRLSASPERRWVRARRPVMSRDLRAAAGEPRQRVVHPGQHRSIAGAGAVDQGLAVFDDVGLLPDAHPEDEIGSGLRQRLAQGRVHHLRAPVGVRGDLLARRGRDLAAGDCRSRTPDPCDTLIPLAGPTWLSPIHRLQAVESPTSRMRCVAHAAPEARAVRTGGSRRGPPRASTGRGAPQYSGSPMSPDEARRWCGARVRNDERGDRECVTPIGASHAIAPRTPSPPHPNRPLHEVVGHGRDGERGAEAEQVECVGPTGPGSGPTTR